MKVCHFLLLTIMLGIGIEKLTSKYLLVQLEETEEINKMSQKSLETIEFKNSSLKGSSRSLMPSNAQIQEPVSKGTSMKPLSKGTSKKPLSKPLKKEDVCYQKLENTLNEENQGELLYRETGLNTTSYDQCKLKCEELKKCKNFEFCPGLKICRLFSNQIITSSNLKQTQFFDCFTSYKTCDTEPPKNLLQSRGSCNAEKCKCGCRIWLPQGCCGGCRYCD